MSRFIKTKAQRSLAIISIIAIVWLAFLFFAPIVLPFDASKTDLSNSLVPPLSSGYLFGSDNIGRDVFLRTIAGGSESVFMAFIIVALTFLVGCIAGLTAGFCGGIVDEILDKVITMFQAFPSFVLAIAIAAILGQGMTNMIIAISLVYWTQPARLTRSLVLSLKNSEAIRAAIVCGAKFRQICMKHLLPAISSPLIVMAALSIGDVILTMAGLSFLGLGPERPTNEWGMMISEARSTMQFAPWTILVPGIALLITVTISNLFGDILRDVLEGRSAEIEEVREAPTTNRTTASHTEPLTQKRVVWRTSFLPAKIRKRKDSK